MHPCLKVQEILDLIFTQVYHDSPGRASRHDMISLALTCHYFAETSLDVLWHTQSNLVPLIKTLPDRCWKEEPNTGFERMFALTIAKPTDDELRRFATYAQRIRRISYLPYPFHCERKRDSPLDHPYNPHLHQVSPVDNENYPLDLKALHILWTDRQDKTIPLFPNLLRVEFVHISQARRCLDVVLQTKGISVSLQWSDSSDGNVTSLFPIIEQYALNMQELDLGPLQNSENEDCAHLSRLVSKMTDLRRLSCASRVLDPYAIRHLASLPYLRSLQIANTSDQILHALRRDSFSGLPFPALHHLVMPVDDLFNFANLVKHLRPLQLQDIFLHVSKLQPKSDFHDMFEALEQASSKFSNVRRIILKYTPRYTYGRQRHEDSNVFPIVHIKTSTLKPLLSFTDLSVLELHVPCQINLGDKDIMTMADAWPSLKRLQLGSLGEWNLPHLITYNGFLHLLRSCPELEHLAFSFNAASEIPTPSQISPACINQRITYLYLGDSTIGANTPELVGRFFAQVLPKLCGIGGKWLARPPGEQQWEDVVNALKKFKDDGPP